MTRFELIWKKRNNCFVPVDSLRYRLVASDMCSTTKWLDTSVFTRIKKVMTNLVDAKAVPVEKNSVNLCSLVVLLLWPGQQKLTLALVGWVVVHFSFRMENLVLVLVSRSSPAAQCWTLAQCGWGRHIVNDASCLPWCSLMYTRSFFSFGGLVSKWGRHENVKWVWVQVI